MSQPSGLAATTSDRDLYALVEEFFATSFGTDNVVITEAVRRMLAAGGKRLRPRLTLLAAEANGVDARDHLPLAAYMELIHVGTLIHDDVVDRADTRRGVNATAIDFGNRVSVLAGDYLFAWIFKNVTASYAPPIPNILSSTLADITDGEVLQLRAQGRIDLTIDGYVEIVVKKTATLFAASAECGAIAAGASASRVRALREFGRCYGIAFQMLDDLLDFTASEAELGKPVGNDVRERKMTLPVILALQHGTPAFRDEVAAFYGADDDANAEAAIRSILAGVETHHGLAAARDHVAQYVERATHALAPLGNSSVRTEFASLAAALERDARARTI